MSLHPPLLRCLFHHRRHLLHVTRHDTRSTKVYYFCALSVLCCVQFLFCCMLCNGMGLLIWCMKNKPMSFIWSFPGIQFITLHQNGSSETSQCNRAWCCELARK
jgi:hypothetical protein